MARLPRILPVDIPVHIIQRGNNRQVCFVADEDYSTYLDWVKNYSKLYKVNVHAWVLMTNHVHLLCTPRRQGAVSQMMQAIGRQYVRYFNRKYNRSGTLWEGRYRSCLVQQERYLLELYRYIERNPVRAGMVKDPGDYKWSSYAFNALGVISDLCTPHPEYLKMGKNSEELRAAYRELLDSHVEKEHLTDIRSNVNKGFAVGNELFKEEMESLTGRRLMAKKRGRPVGWRKKEK